MGRILGIDFGLKRCGLAATDILRISLNPLGVFDPEGLFIFLEKYIREEDVDLIVIGLPLHKDGNPTNLVQPIHDFEKKIKEKLKVKTYLQDEFYSSQEAVNTLKEMKIKNSRENKHHVDQVSAIIILKRYLENNKI